MSTLTFIGSQTIGEVCPFAVSALTGAFAVILPKLQAQLAGVLALQASLTVTPPTLAANIDVATKLLAALNASVSLGLPGVSFQLQAVAALIAKLQLDIGALIFPPLFLVGGIDLYAYDGRVSEMGGAITASLAVGLPGGTPANGSCNALLMIAETPVIWAAMQAFFKTG